jgi:integrase
MRRRLTEAAIRGLKTAKAQEDVFHDGSPSAGLRLTRDGRKTFFVVYRSPVVKDEKGEPKQRRYYFGEHETGKAGEPRYLSLEEFKTEYQIFRGEVAKGIDPQETPGTATEERQAIPATAVPEWLRGVFPEGYKLGTVAALLAEYFEAARTGKGNRQLSPRTLNGYVSTAKTHLVKRFGKRVATDITPDDISDLYSDLTKTAPQMTRQVKKVLSGAFEYGRAHVKELKRVANPTLGVRITVPKNSRDRWLTEEELEVFLEKLPSLSDSKAKDVYTLILSSGCRPGEAAGIKAEDVITMNGERAWKIRYKVDRDHLIPLMGPIAEIINRRILEVGGKGALFWDNVDSESEYPEQLKRANKEIRTLTEIPDIRPHDLRRTMRTHVSSLGVSDAVGEALLNHSKQGEVKTYNLYTYWKERIEALTLWHAKLAVIKAGRRTQAA